MENFVLKLERVGKSRRVSIFYCFVCFCIWVPAGLVAETESWQGNRIIEEMGNHICSRINRTSAGGSRPIRDNSRHARVLSPAASPNHTKQARFCETIGGHNAIFRTKTHTFSYKCATLSGIFITHCPNQKFSFKESLESSFCVEKKFAFL